MTLSIRRLLVCVGVNLLVCSLWVATAESDETGGLKVYPEGTYSEAEPNMDVEVSPPGPYSLEQTHSAVLDVGVNFGSKDSIARVKSSRDVVLAELKPTEGSEQTQYVLSLKLRESNERHAEQVVLVTVSMEWPNGRQVSKPLTVFVNSGGLKGEVLPADSKLPPSVGNLSVVAVTNRNQYEGSIVYIDTNANGRWDGDSAAQEPITLVDANNRFNFPQYSPFYYEHLVKPLALRVNGLRRDLGRGLAAESKRDWFKVSEDAGPITALLPAQPQLAFVSKSKAPSADLFGVHSWGVVSRLLAASLTAFHAEAPPTPTILRVKSTPGGEGDWSDAFKSLHEAIQAASSIDAPVEIWLADGVYTPLDKSGFALKPRLTLRGGFRGDEITPADRPRLGRGAILSGDLLANDGHCAPITCLRFSTDGKRLATAGQDRMIKIWENLGDDASPKRWRVTQTLAGHEQSVTSLQFSPDGQLLVSGGDDMAVKLWDLTTGKAIGPPKGDSAHTGSITSVGFSSDGKKFASASRDRTIKLWDAENGAQLGSLEKHLADVTCIAFSTDELLVSGSQDTTLRVWSVSDGDLETLRNSGTQPLRQTIHAHFDGVSGLAAARRDGRSTIASVGRDATTRVWILNDQTAQFELENVVDPTSATTAVAFSDDGQTVFGVASDGALAIWHAAKGKLQHLIDQRGVPRPVSSAGKPDYGAYERQHYASSPGSTRFFVVDDDLTGRHLWGEVQSAEGTHFLQLSQHVCREVFEVDHVQPEGISFEDSHKKYVVARQPSEHVWPTSLFPGQDTAVQSIVIREVTELPVQIESLTDSKLTMHANSPADFGFAWIVEGPEGAIAAEQLTLSEDRATLTLPVKVGKYQVTLERTEPMPQAIRYRDLFTVQIEAQQ